MGALDADAEALLGEAVAATGLDDPGPGDFREGLETYVASVEEEAQLTELGGLAIRSTIVAALANRLRVADWAKTHPEVADERIEAPVVVIGMFRAGTTFLSNLLDQDRTNRPLLRWEATDSAPPPSPADHRVGPRVDEARVAGEMLEALNPAVRAIHHEEADGPTECIAVMSQDFKSLSWEAIANVPTYGAWLWAADQRSAYEYHRTVLQVLQSAGVRGRWTLKSPHHALALDALTAVYPDARLVLLHRDPVVLSASVCSLISTLSGTFTDADHQRYIADHWTSMLEESVNRIGAFRDRHPEHPITDVRYADLVSDPLEAMGALYDALGEELTGPAHDTMARYVETHPKGTFGTHGYDLASHGLDADELTDRFAAYTARYDIPPESPRT
jgi:hypothetical protein